MTVVFRPASTDADRTFVVASWLFSFKKSHSAGLICVDDWITVMDPQLKRILDRDGTSTVIACDKDDPDYFYGWIAGDVSEAVPVVFYCYVKEPYRRTGIAHGLFSALGVNPDGHFVFVCRPASNSTELLRKVPRAKFNPLEARYPKRKAI